MSKATANSEVGASLWSRGSGLKAVLRSPEVRRYLPLLVLTVLILLIGLTVPNFMTGRNMVSVVRQSASLGLMAIGMSVVLIAGGIDISIPSVMALSGIFGAMYMRAGGSPVISVLIMLGVGVTAGIINGFAVAYLKMIPFVVTLAMMAIATGANTWLTKSVSITGVDMTFVDAVMGRVLGIPIPIIILVVAAVLMWFLMRRSIYGRWLYSVGTNERAARVCGVPTDRVVFGTFVTSGLFAGIAAVVVTARLASASSTMGNDGIVLNIIGASVVGGVSIYGGVGNALGAAVGAVFITLISNSMNMMGLSFMAGLVVKGLVIILVVAVDSIQKSRQG